MTASVNAADSFRADEIRPLTALRGVAAFAVLLFHLQMLTSQTFANNGDLFTLWPNGYLLLDLFFILSGFIIAHVHGNDFTKLRRFSSYKKFIMLRFFRIYPIHVAVLFVYLVYEIGKFAAPRFFIFQPFSENTIWRAAENIFLIQSWGIDTTGGWNLPSWSISTEWAAYLVTPLIFSVLLHRGKATGIAGATAAAGALTTLAVLYGNLNTKFDFGLIRCIAEYCVGVFLLKSFKQIRGSGGVLESILRALTPAFLTATAVSLALEVNDVIITALFGADILGLALAQESSVGRAFSMPIPMFLGRVSYSLYMVHYFVVLIAGSVFRKFSAAFGSGYASTAFMAVEFLGVIVASLVAASLSFRYIEAPGRSLGRRLSQRGTETDSEDRARAG